MVVRHSASLPFNTPFFLFRVSSAPDLYTLSLHDALPIFRDELRRLGVGGEALRVWRARRRGQPPDRKSTRLNSSHLVISYAVFCLKKKNRMHRVAVDQEQINEDSLSGGARHECRALMDVV